MKVIFLIGMPASGKTTWAKKMCEEKQDSWNYARVNKDDLRNMMFNGEYNFAYEEWVKSTQLEAIVRLLKEGCAVIVDNTHLKKNDISELQNQIVDILGTTPIFEVNTSFLSVSIRTCIERNAKRESGRVPNEAMERMAALVMERRADYSTKIIEKVINNDSDK